MERGVRATIGSVAAPAPVEQSEVFQSQEFAGGVPGLSAIAYKSTPNRERLVTILASSARGQTAPEAGAPSPCDLGHQYF